MLEVTSVEVKRNQRTAHNAQELQSRDGPLFVNYNHSTGLLQESKV
jgi:hypothetical protein